MKKPPLDDMFERAVEEMAKRLRTVSPDPVEELIRQALTHSNLPHQHGLDVDNGLDFFLPLPTGPVYIECKRFHTARIAEQMSRHTDVIAVQGMAAAGFMASLIRGDT